MLPRRLLFAAPLLALPAHARAAHAHPDWRHEVNELRFGVSGLKAQDLEPALRQRLRIRVTGLPDQGGALVHELDRGHAEFALLDGPTLAAARARMRHRLIVGRKRPDGLVLVVRRVLPHAMRQDLAAALA